MATTDRPLRLSLCLGAYVPLPPRAPPADLLDQLDQLRTPLSVLRQPEGPPAAQAKLSGDTRAGEASVWTSALSDSTTHLFPSVPPASVAELPLEPDGTALPEWLRETSGRVTSMAAARIPLGAVTAAGIQEVELGASLEVGQEEGTTFRVAVGCQDGTLWLFGEPQQTSLPPPSSSVLSSPPTSPMRSSWTQSKSSSPPSQTFGTSSIEVAPPSPGWSSPTKPSLGRIDPRDLYPKGIRPSSIRRGSLNPSLSPTLGSMEHASVGRPRKASATVSMSIAVDQPSAVGPLSPTFPSGLLSPALGGRNGSGKHGAKDSITSGIGLWEHESSTAGSLLDRSEVNEPDTQVEAEVIAVDHQESLDRLEPLLRVRLGGWGEIVMVKVVEGLRFGRVEGGKVVVCLRRNGQLSIHSLVDGRAFGACNVADGVPSASRRGALCFEGFEVLSLADSVTAICYARNGRNGVGLACIDLDSFESRGVVGTDRSRPTLVFREGAPFLLSASPVASENTSDLLAHPIFFEQSGDKKSARIGAHSNAGPLSGLSGTVLGIQSCGEDCIAFDRNGILLFTLRDQAVGALARLELPGIVDVCAQGFDAVIVSTLDCIRTYHIVPAGAGETGSFEFVLQDTELVDTVEALCHLPASSSGAAEFLVARSSLTSPRGLELVSVPCSLASSNDSLAKGMAQLAERRHSLFTSTPSDTREDRITTQTPLDPERILLGFSSGAICSVTYPEMLDLRVPTVRASLGSAVSCMTTLELEGRRVLVAGSVDGSAAMWDLSDWTLLSNWSLFASPVCAIVDLPIKGTRRLLALISSNSPIALVDLSMLPAPLLFILPGTRSPVTIVSSNANGELLVVYESGLARVCDVAGQELRRSMDYKTAVALLAEASWVNWFTLRELQPSNEPSARLHDPILTVDLRTTIDRASGMLPWAKSNKSVSSKGKSQSGNDSCDLTADTKKSHDHLGLVQFLLAQTIPFGVDLETDAMLEDHLGVQRPSVVMDVALQSPSAVAMYVQRSAEDAWTTSPTASAQRLLSIICLLRVFLNFPDTERYASELIAHYASMLADAVGPTFCAPSLDTLASFWLDKSTEVHQAARLLFGSYLGAASDSNVVQLAERWQDLLPSRQAADGPHFGSADQAVLIIGLIASERFKLLSAATLKDVSNSISDFLADHEHPHHQAIAVELLSRGFELWQNYVDAMELVRHLFGLATGKHTATPTELRNMARQATLHVATVNTPLFMTTLSFDILNATTAASRIATMKLLGFMIRKKPLVLFTSLPRLAEAVVKSLDPTVTALRETVQQSATVILNELVRTYPSIDFHGKSQRLAVGTHEGAAIVYDLKTATRLYVLEGHQRAVTALSWSPDGRRLVTVSLEESKVVVWKVGVGILSLFTPGMPPSGGVPFKTLDFNVGDEGLMTNAAALEWVGFEWPTERTARLRIRETALTFSV